MSSASNQLPTPDGPRRRTGRSRLGAALNALLWLSVLALAVAPFPW